MNRNLHSILFELWAIRPEFAMSYLPVVRGMLKGEATTTGPDEFAAMRAALAPVPLRLDGTEMEDPEEAQAAEAESMVMRIPIQGAITKYGGMCSYGAVDHASWLAQADADERFVGVLLDIDSGGGSGNGMNLLNDRLRRMKKPVVAITQSGMACSAAFGIGAHAMEHYALLGTDEFGSVGTLTTLPNMKKYWAAEGLDLHDIYATRSTDKNSAWMEALKADPNDPNDPHYKRIREEFLDPFNEAFIAAMKSARPAMAATEKEWSTGKVFGADMAKRLGMIDGYSTPEGCIDRIRELAKAGSTQSNTQPKSGDPSNAIPTTNMKNLKEMTAGMIAGVKNFFTSDAEVNEQTIAGANAALESDGFKTVKLVSTERLKGVEEAEAKVQEAHTKAEAAEAKAETAATELSEATTKLTTADSELTKKTGELAEATKKIGELESAVQEGKDTIAKLENEQADDMQPKGPKGGKGDADPAETSGDAEVDAFNAKVRADLAEFP